MSHTFDQFGFIQFPFHFQAKTNNPNNLYTVDIVDDPNVTGLGGIDNAELTPSGEAFYTFGIRPKNYGNLVCAGDFIIDGISSSYTFNTNYITPGVNINSSALPCYPPLPPWYGSGVGQHLGHSTSHSYTITGVGSNDCWGPNSSIGTDFTGIDTRAFNGPFVFDNSAYCDGDFLTSSKSVTWRKIILVDIYQAPPPLALYYNINLNPAQEPDLEKWVVKTPKDFVPNPFGIVPELQPAHNGYPAFVRAFVFPEQHPSNPLQANMLVEIDIDLIAPVNGCTDTNANNYDAAANRNDGTCVYPPPPEYSITISDGGGTGGLYTNEYDNNTFGSGVTAPDRNLVFNNDGSDVVLANTYAAGDIVNETVSIDLVPQLDQNSDITVFNFSSGTPAGNIPMTLGYSNRGSDWGDAKNNLTGASIRIQNTGDPSIIRVGSLAGVTQEFSEWHITVDPTGYRPEKTTVFEVNPGTGTFTAKVTTTDSTGNNLDVTTGTVGASTHGGISIVEHYYPTGDPAITAQPALEHFPYKLELIIEIKDFVMPAEDVNIAMIIDHNTENQGDPNWVLPSPVYGCTNPIALNYDPLANINQVSSTDPSDPCVLPIYGCTVSQATNYNPLANVDDGSCTYAGGGKILCTTIYESTGLTDWEEKGRLWNRHLNKHLTKYHQIGYHALFYQFTLLMKKYKPIFKLGKYMTVQRSKDLEAVMNNEQRHLPGMIIRYIFEPICYVVGLIKSKI